MWYLKSSLPDPQVFSLEEILELRQTLSRAGVLEQWWETLAAAINRLHAETLTEEQASELRQQLQKAANVMRQFWPTPERLAHFLQLEGWSYLAMQPHRAFALATGLQAPNAGLHSLEGKNGLTLLLSPAVP